MKEKYFSKLTETENSFPEGLHDKKCVEGLRYHRLEATHTKMRISRNESKYKRQCFLIFNYAKIHRTSEAAIGALYCDFADCVKAERLAQVHERWHEDDTPQGSLPLHGTL